MSVRGLEEEEEEDDDITNHMVQIGHFQSNLNAVYYPQS